MMHRRCETREVIGKTIKRSPRLVRYVKGEGKGYTCALNRGLAESHGEWLALFDDDELADPDWLKELYTFAVHIGAQCVGGVPRTRVPGDLVFYEGANIENRTKIFSN